MTNEKLIRPLLAKDVDESKLKFPVGVTAKIDGSFAFIQNGKLYARSLKPHENLYVTKQYSSSDFNGLRGELIVGDNPTAPDLCRNTSSVLRTITGEPKTSLWCFDYVLPETKDLPYEERIRMLVQKVAVLRRLGYSNIYSIPVKTVFSLDEYKKLRDVLLSEGYEGCVVRCLKSKHKEGRSSAVKPDLWRYKPWGSAEIRVTRLVEELKNNNEATKNELGQTERSSHKDNLEGKDTLGAIVGLLVTPLLDSNGKEVAPVGIEITIATGSLTEKEKQDLWYNPVKIVGQVVEFEYCSFGLKEKPRFAQFKRIRSVVDM
jgi:DNA ligase-1